MYSLGDLMFYFYNGFNDYNSFACHDLRVYHSMVVKIIK